MSLAWLFAQAIAASPVFSAVPVPDAVLADLRGGIELPNGIDLALTVQTQTAIDGAIVLQTVYSLVEGPPKILVFAPPSGRSVPLDPGSSAGAAVSSLLPTVVFDGSTGVQVTPGLAILPVAVGSGTQNAAAAVAGLEQVDASSVVTDAGEVTRALEGPQQAVSLTGTDFSVTHYLGGTFGSVIANTGNDRTINTVTTVSIDLRNAGPEVLGSALLRVEDVAIGALASRY